MDEYISKAAAVKRIEHEIEIYPLFCETEEQKAIGIAALQHAIKMINAETETDVVPKLRAELETAKAERDAAIKDLHKLVPAWKWDGKED